MPGSGKNLCDPRLLLGMLMMETNERLLSERVTAQRRDDAQDNRKG